MSDPPIYTSRPLAHALVQASRARTIREKVRPFQALKPKDLLPVPPAIVEHSTGLSMGESAEKMAKENGITRAQQDEIALASHLNAAAAWNEGFFSDWVMPLSVAPRYEPTVEQDNLFRADASMRALSELTPVFDKKFGTVTAGNSSPLTDGAAALMVMSEETAKRLNRRPLGFLRSFAFAATNPAEQLLQGPAYAAPLALERAGMTLKDIDIFEMHEAFAAQVASNLQAFASSAFAQKIGRTAPLGEVDRTKLNLAGGSLSLGHPFAATGARLIYQALKLLQKKDKTTALVTACAQGGLGAAVVLERI
jgi:acetyl-CoA acyltransferase